MPPTQDPRALHRRAGRTVLRGLRPLALPLLNRLQLRMRQVVEDSDLGAATQDFSERLERIEAHLRGDAAALLAGMRALQLGLEGIARDQATLAARMDATDATLSRVLGPADTRMRSLQIALDALRLDQAAANRGLEERIGGLALDRPGLDRAPGEQSRAAMDAAPGLADIGSDTGSDTGLERLLRRVAVPLGDAVLVRMSEGYLLVPSEDVALLAALIESDGRMAAGRLAVIRAVLREGDVALDLGAHLGMTTIPAARRVGATGRVIAVEPAARAAGLLRRSLAMDGLDGRVMLHQCAAGAAPGWGVLNIGPVSARASLLPMAGGSGSEERTEEVEIRPLDELVAPGTPVRLVMIDVEGSEAGVWRGMRRIEAENPELAVLVAFGPENPGRAGIAPAEWMAMFTEAGFTAFEVEAETGALRPARPPAELTLAGSVDLLMLRQPADAYPDLRLV